MLHQQKKKARRLATGFLWRKPETRLYNSNVQQLKLLGEGEKRENAMDTGRNGRNQLQINVRKRKKGNELLCYTIMR